MPQTRFEKIVQRFAVGLPDGHRVRAGDTLRIRPAHVLTHDNAGAVLPKFRGLGARRVHRPEQPVIALDHDIQNRSPENLAKYGAIEAFAREQGLAFFPAGRGIAHQVMVEEGFVRPDTFVVAADSHANLYGALGAVGTPVVRTDAAVLWATGETWWEVPPVARVELAGTLRAGVTGKDVILALLGEVGDRGLNHAVEFVGDGVAALSMDARMTLANMTTEWGAIAGVFPWDDPLQRYLKSRREVLSAAGRARPGVLEALDASLAAEPIRADADAEWAREVRLELEHVVPNVAGPDRVKDVTPLPEIEARRIPIQKAYLLSCVNSRLEDLEAAARVVRGRKVADGVRLYVAAASSEVEAEARRTGVWDDLLAAGAIPLPSGCGPCIGLGEGVLEPGETAISATNRNFRGRMGSPDAHAYLASPAVVAASALAGHIAGPERFESVPLIVSARDGAAAGRRGEEEAAGKIEGFPERLDADLVLLPGEDLNTDAIYPKDVTYRDGLTDEEMARHLFLHHDPRFVEVARAGDVLVGGTGFGAGSSREQAVTALRAFGIRAVIAASFSRTYRRNALNHGFLLLECPTLVDRLRADFPGSPPTIRTGRRATIDLRRWHVRVDEEEFSIRPLPVLARRLIAEGGVEAMVRRGSEPTGPSS